MKYLQIPNILGLVLAGLMGQVAYSQATTPSTTAPNTTPSAKQENADVQDKLGISYATGKGMPLKTGVKQPNASASPAEQDHIAAQYHLGLCYYPKAKE